MQQQLEQNLKLLNACGQDMAQYRKELHSGTLTTKKARELSSLAAKEIRALGTAHIEARRVDVQALNAETRAKREERLAKESEKHSPSS